MKTQLVALLFVLLGLSTPAYAQTPTGASISPTFKARSAGVKTENLDRLKEKANREIDRRIAGLNRLIDLVNRIKRLTDSQKTDLTTQVQNQITSLQTLKTKIAADTDIATLRADVQSIVKDYRIYALFIPKIYIIANADRLLDIANEMTQVAAKLQIRIDAAKAVGNDTGEMQKLLTDYTAKVADAKSQAQNAINTVLPLTPDGYPGNKTTLMSARTMLQAARASLRTANKDSQQIRQLLVRLGIKVNAKITPVGSTPTLKSTPTPTP